MKYMQNWRLTLQLIKPCRRFFKKSLISRNCSLNGKKLTAVCISFAA
jgi:hypothetical protein